MHEMGIAASVLDAVRREMTRYPGRRAARVGLRIGDLAGVDGESVRFCFGVMANDSELAPLALSIEESAGDELDFAFLEMDEEEEMAAA